MDPIWSHGNETLHLEIDQRLEPRHGHHRGSRSLCVGCPQHHSGGARRKGPNAAGDFFRMFLSNYLMVFWIKNKSEEYLPFFWICTIFWFVLCQFELCISLGVEAEQMPTSTNRNSERLQSTLQVIVGEPTPARRKRYMTKSQIMRSFFHMVHPVFLVSINVFTHQSYELHETELDPHETTSLKKREVFLLQWNTLHPKRGEHIWLFWKKKNKGNRYSLSLHIYIYINIVLCLYACAKRTL